MSTEESCDKCKNNGGTRGECQNATCNYEERVKEVDNDTKPSIDATIQKLRKNLIEEANKQPDLTAKVADLQELSVTKIMIAIVPGEDGMGHEVYAKSVDDVERLLSRLSEKAEDYELEVLPMKRRISELTEQVKVAKEAFNTIANWLVCAPITTAEDMAQAFPAMLAVCEEALAKLSEEGVTSNGKTHS